eukprot:3291743-Rhodomonas_salina.4
MLNIYDNRNSEPICLHVKPSGCQLPECPLPRVLRPRSLVAHWSTGPSGGRKEIISKGTVKHFPFQQQLQKCPGVQELGVWWDWDRVAVADPDGAGILRKLECVSRHQS